MPREKFIGLKKKEEIWFPVSDHPNHSGLYEVKFQKGRSCVRFYSGWTKGAWLAIGSKENQVSEPQPTHWRFLENFSNEMHEQFPEIYKSDYLS